MKVSLIITTFERPAYLQRCLDSVRRSDLSQVDCVMIVDDCSQDKQTIKLINDFELEGVELIKAFSKENRSIKGSLLFGCDLLFNESGIVVNLDGDAVVRRDFLEVLLRHKQAAPNNIITGFNCTTKNKDGSTRHHIMWAGEDYNMKTTVGGINMLFGKTEYEKYIRPALVETLSHGGNWDHKACLNSKKDNLAIRCSVPSVIDHIGIEISSMGHSIGGEPPDRADDFDDDFQIYMDAMYKYDLRKVTLICADGADVNRVIHAANISCRDIEFGAVKILSHLTSDDPRVIKIRPLLSSKDYSQFVLKEMINYVDTDYMMIFQHDGFPINPDAWSEDFLKYDMVGAAWKFRPEKRTANGGFSLRSRKMMEIIKNDDSIFLQNDSIIRNFAEDHVLFYIYRDYLEGHHGIKIAPEETCDRFSIEAWGVPDNKYKGSFGFHGFNTDFSEADLPYIPYKLPNRQIL
jgi:hypothetical protein